MRTHALIGLVDLTARYPISPADATELLERWAEEGKAIRIDGLEWADGSQWAERDNLAEMRRATVAARRRESLSVSPEVFADFLLRWQHVHPSTRGEGPAFVETVLQQLQGFAMPARLWESEILPRRVEGFRPAWLDEVFTRGAWLWRAEGDGKDEPRVAFFPRDFPDLRRDGDPESQDLPADEARIREILERSGASFATDLARTSGIEPSRVRRALSGLMARGLVTNDRFDPLRPGADSSLQALNEATADRRNGRSLRIRPRRTVAGQAEGRWSRLAAPSDDPEAVLMAWTGSLLDRYGVLTREMVALEPSAPAWSELAPILARAEWRGELRRGYFVEGLSGLQYATEEAASELARLAASAADPASPVILLSTVDPANIYGSGAPLDVELLDGGIARLPRNPGNFLAIRDGRPVLIVEAYAKRLTGLPWAASTDIDSALKLLASLTGPG